MTSADERRLRAQVALAVLVANADGFIAELEMEALGRRLARRLGAIDPSHIEAYLREALQEAERRGVETTVELVAADLDTAAARREAVDVALDVATADGRLRTTEAHRVAAIADLLGLSEDELVGLLAARTRQ